ncbi:MAG: preprotein translocase subunit SecG [Planctomycetes bacterium]|nr:preprotein translocase subunit SecG [Planctomycetota bacterium]
MIHLAVLPYYVHSLLVLLFLMVSVLMILVILIQKPQGGGLSGAFGAGASSGQTAFGAKTGDMLTWLTVGMFCMFVMIAIVLNFTTRQNPFATAVPTTIQGVAGSEGAGGGEALPDSTPAEQPADQPDEQPPPADQTQPGETPTQAEPGPKTEPGQADPPETAEGEPDPPPPTVDPGGGPPLHS